MPFEEGPGHFLAPSRKPTFSLYGMLIVYVCKVINLNVQNLAAPLGLGKETDLVSLVRRAETLYAP